MRRWLRCLVCLLVICALLVNLFPAKAEATAAGAVGIAKASLVTGNPAIIVGAALLAVGVAAGVESGAFENLVDNAVSYLDSAGSWIADGSMQLLQTVTEAGQTAYYVAGDLLESLRSWLFDTEILSEDSVFYQFATSHTITYWGGTVTITESYRWIPVVVCKPITGQYSYSDPHSGVLHRLRQMSDGSYSYAQYSMTSAFSLSKLSSNIKVLVGDPRPSISEYCDKLTSGEEKINEYDLSIGNVSSVPIDGTSARTWAPDVADRNGLYVKYNNDPEPPDDNNGKWFWRLALPLTILDLIAMSQADEWTGETPEEFPTGDTVTEFEILDRPEIDGYQGIEVSPITDPSPGTGGDSGEDPDTGGDTDPTAPGEPSPDLDPDPDPEGGLDPDPDPGTDPDAGGDTGSDTGGDLVDVKPVNFFLDLRNYFPFCIPFDIAAFIGALVAPAEAPVFHWELQDLSGNVYPIDVDLSPWDAHAQLFRDVQLVLFIIGLALITRNMIKW